MMISLQMYIDIEEHNKIVVLYKTPITDRLCDEVFHWGPYVKDRNILQLYEQ